MTKDAFVKAVQAHFGDETSTFKTRIENSIPVGIELFCSEAQWECLDKYVSIATEVDSRTGKTRLALSTITDFAKIVHLATQMTQKIEYIDRDEWNSRQTISLSAQEPIAYTVIGNDHFLDRPNNGAVIYLTYTRNHENIDLAGLPARYHGAVLMAVIWFLTPGMITVGTERTDNPAKRIAWQGYQERVGLAISQEEAHKDRVRRLAPDDASETRAWYR